MTIFFSLIKNFLLKFWKEILIVIVAILVYTFIYNKGYDNAYKERTQYYESVLKKNHEELVTKLDTLETESSILSNTTRKNHDKLVGDLTSLTKDMKSKNLYIVKNGECVPSEDFSMTFNSIISRANRK